MLSIVGRDITPVVGLKVREILGGGFRQSKEENALETGEITGTVERVIKRVSAQSQSSVTLSCGVVWEPGGEMQVPPVHERAVLCLWMRFASC
jgi:hypothetical protein